MAVPVQALLSDATNLNKNAQTQTRENNVYLIAFFIEERYDALLNSNILSVKVSHFLVK